jgi:3-dehydroquinate synthase
MLRGIGDPVDVHEIDEGLMREAIGRLERLDPGPWVGEVPAAARPEEAASSSGQADALDRAWF